MEYKYGITTLTGQSRFYQSNELAHGTIVGPYQSIAFSSSSI
ncbi:hypothetical protein AXFE_12560 [Acidithrix ferrooxidans]|uniref:Uncharacterized protein n=1 Tax=Acidithrix ferrooxidans TaxID=1280514 RepID=A0A0D8HLD7_9ACTN|nr:hypothetical protein AXFE_12560 [Acidithrix ferrooxidans]CAG4929191.1 unnamed protein product [Acidithrix sp. C25]